MKIFRLFSIAAAALMMAACSTEETALNNNPAAGPQMQFTATIAAPSSGATTRTEYTEVTTGEAAGTINVVWKAGDEIALIHNGKADVVKVETVNEDGSATITGDITVGTNGEAVEVCYPAALWEWNDKAQGAIRNETFVTNITTKQDGTLKYIQDNLDTRMGKGTLKVDGDKATLSDNVKLASQIAIWKLTLQDNAETPADLSATQVSVKLGGEQPVPLAGTTTLGTATSTVYLAIDKLDAANITIEATVGEDTYSYTNEGVSLALGQYYQSKVMMEKPWDGNLATVTKNVTATDGTTIYGTLGKNVMISIADGATVTLAGVTINGNGIGDQQCDWAGITCEGDANIILKDGSTNTVTGFNWSCPGIYVPENKTLTIKGETAGTGKLTASSCKQGNGAGIGGGMFIDCGNIEIQGGFITAYGGDDAAGIGSANNSNCGSITISGGTVNATSDNDGAGIGSGNTGTCTTITISGGTVVAKSGDRGAGIGSGFQGTCGNISISGGTIEATGGAKAAGIGTGQYGKCVDITITTGVTKVTATKGSDSPNSIGAGTEAESCGTVTIGGVVGAISTSPYTYPVPALNLTSPAVGQVIGDDGKNYDYASLPGGVTAVAKICYVSGSNGLALALADEGQMNWSTAISTCAAHTPAFTGGTWKLATQDEWNNMITAAGSYTDLRDGFTSVDGTNMQSDNYWSSTEYNAAAWYFKFGSGGKDVDGKDKDYYYVRSALAF